LGVIIIHPAGGHAPIKECKRRKIKCDRAQPCGPCTRRNEQAKCQWHIVEPIEKYVTRAEYDELKARVAQLEQSINLFRAPPTENVPQYYPMSMSTGIPAGPPTNVSSYNPPTHAQQPTGMGYQMMPPTFIQAPQPPQHRYTGPDSPRTAVSPRHMQPQNPGSMQQQSPSSSPVIQTTHGGGGAGGGGAGGGGGGAPSPSRNPKSPQSASAKNSPLSLASITSPYNTTDTQSKNYQRRRTLGERLRLVTPHEDPAVRFNGARRWRGHQRRARKNSWSGARRIRVCHSKYSLGSPGGIVILLPS
jgi:hypothetical protein